MIVRVLSRLTNFIIKPDFVISTETEFKKSYEFIVLNMFELNKIAQYIVFKIPINLIKTLRL